MEQKVKGIYKITNIANGMFYVGQSNNIYHRWKQHKTKFEKGKHDGGAFQYDYNLFGAEAFRYEILEVCGDGAVKNDLIARECAYIKELHPQYNATEEYLYNDWRNFYKWRGSIGEELITEILYFGFDNTCVNIYPLKNFIGITEDDIRFFTRYSKVWVPICLDFCKDNFLVLYENSCVHVIDEDLVNMKEIKIHI